jgi:dolichol-phosphate mannosyltransferase
MKLRTLVVLPTYNERPNIEIVVIGILNSLPDCHILVVDDNSPDGTGDAADGLTERFPGAVFVLHRAEKKGLGKAYSAAFSTEMVRKYGVVVQMDADMSHEPNSLPLLVQALHGSDLVIGTRYAGGIRIINWSLNRLLLSQAATIYTAIVTGMRFSDMTSGFRAWRREALDTIDWERTVSSGYLFQIEALFSAYRADMRITEIPIIYHDRRSGSSKFSRKIVVEALWGIPWLRVRALFRSCPRRRRNP